MKVPLVKASFMGARGDLNKVIQALKTTAAFQKTFYKKAERTDDAINCDEYDRLVNLQKRIESVCKFANIKCDDETMSTTDVYDVIKKLEQLQGELHHIESTIKYNEDTIRELGDYVELPVPFNMLQSTKSITILCGIMPIRKFGQFERDFAHTKMNIQSFPSGKTSKCIVITAHNDDAAILDVIHSYEFIPCRFTYEKTAVQQIELMQSKTEQLVTRREQINTDAHLDIEQERNLVGYLNHISNEVDTMDLVATTLMTKHYYVLNGWVIESEVEKIKELLNDVSPAISMSFEQPNEEDDVPVLLKNSPVVTPFRTVTSMYGQPGARDMDPNPFVAFFYFLFFGMMIGDVGYAVVLALAVGAFIYFKKPKAGTKQFMLLFGICAASALMWGFFFGSAFGFNMGIGVVNPLDGAITVLLLALGLGLLQMSVGLILDVYNKIRNGEHKKAILKGIPRVIFFLGLILWLPAMGLSIFNEPSVAFFDAINPAGMWITIIGAVTTALSNPYSLVTYFNDLISYVRLFALALVGTVIAMIGNQIGGMMFGLAPGIGHILGVTIAIAFHIFNLGLGLLGAYIHGARLQFIEFFSKFYAGDGKEFRPIGIGKKGGI